MKNLLLTLLVGFSFIFFACTKQNVITDASAALTLKTDTLTFDTVFTDIGSTTLSFKIHNSHNQAINVSNIDLAGGENSQFRLNINGAAINSGTDYLIGAKDSMYIHVEVTVDPTNEDLPFIIKDSVVFSTNGNSQKVILIAYGQNANYYNAQVIGDTNWSANRPYLIYNSILVDSGQTLTIEEGCQLHFHKNSRLYVRGTLVVNGTLENPVIFRHDRLEAMYDDIAGQWDGIHFLKGANQSYINHAIIENAIVGIRVDSLPVIGNGQVEYNTRPGIYDSLNIIPNVLVENTTIKNISTSGLIGITAVVEMKNSLIYNCGQHNVQLEFGGTYDFDFCSFVNYSTNSTVGHSNPILRMANYFGSATSGIQVASNFDANFTHCIIDGSNEDEIEIDSIGFPSSQFKYVFQNSLIKYSEAKIDSNRLIDALINEDPMFTAIYEDDYTLQETSPCIDAGNKYIGASIYHDGAIRLDLFGNDRFQGILVDIGAYEKPQ